MEQNGHLFVVHGQIEKLVHDAAVLPVGQRFVFSPDWIDLIGKPRAEPEGWTDRRFGRIMELDEPVWAISVGPSGVVDDYKDILGRIRGALKEIADQSDGLGVRCRGAGTLPLVALPVIGIGRAGHGSDRGGVITKLVSALIDAAEQLRLDIALVARESSVYAAAQYARRTTATDLPDDVERRARDVGADARDGSLALLLGAGVSVAAGLPSWHELVNRLAEGLELPTSPDNAPLSAVDQAELIQRMARGRFAETIVELVSGDDHRPSLLHALLAGLDSREVVTTNYDRLYESAVEGTGREVDSVMPWSSAQRAKRWVLKLHGDITSPDSIVLTRRDMVRYDATNRPSGGVLQSLMLTRRLLVVGTTMTDDNLLRLAHEVLAYRTDNEVSGPFGTVLDVGDDRARARLWEDSLDWLALGSSTGLAGTRAVELFLDRVAFHASRDSSWLLDERFEGLLDSDEDREVARRARELARSLPTGASSVWAPLTHRLEELGVKRSG